MANTAKDYTYEEVVEILDARRRGLFAEELSGLLEGARSAGALTLFWKQYEAFLSPREDSKYQSSVILNNHFRRYALEHENQPIAEKVAPAEPQQPTQEAEPLSFEAVKTAYAEFGKLIKAYIVSQTEAEVAKKLKEQEQQQTQHGEDVATLREEVLWFKVENETLRKENEELKEFKANVQGLLAR